MLLITDNLLGRPTTMLTLYNVPVRFLGTRVKARNCIMNLAHRDIFLKCPLKI
jgi:hypothetical protein